MHRAYALYTLCIATCANAMDLGDSGQLSLFKSMEDGKTRKVLDYILVRDLLPFMNIRLVDECEGKLSVDEDLYSFMKAAPNSIKQRVSHYCAYSFAMKKSYAMSFNSKVIYSGASRIICLQNPQSDILMFQEEDGILSQGSLKDNNGFTIPLKTDLSCIYANPTDAQKMVGCKKKKGTLFTYDYCSKEYRCTPLKVAPSCVHMSMDAEGNHLFTAAYKRIQKWDPATLTCLHKWYASGKVKHLVYMNDSLYSISVNSRSRLPRYYIEQWSDSGKRKKRTELTFPIRSVTADSQNKSLIMGFQGGLCEWWPHKKKSFKYVTIPVESLNWHIDNNGAKSYEVPTFTSIAHDQCGESLLAVDSVFNRVFVFDRDSLRYLHTYCFGTASLSTIVVDKGYPFLAKGRDILELEPSFEYATSQEEATWERALVLQAVLDKVK